MEPDDDQKGLLVAKSKSPGKKRKNTNSQKFNNKWESMFLELKKYKSQYYHCSPPQNLVAEYVRLSSWVHQQRKKYRTGGMQQDRQVRLGSIDFVWEVDRVDGRWYSQYNKLVEIHRFYGHCDAGTVGYADNGLIEWLSDQRDENTNGLLREDRKYLLEKLGANWDANVEPSQQHNHDNHHVGLPVETNELGDATPADNEQTQTAYESVVGYIYKSKTNKRKRILFATHSRKQFHTSQRNEIVPNPIGNRQHARTTMEPAVDPATSSSKTTQVSWFGTKTFLPCDPPGYVHYLGR